MVWQAANLCQQTSHKSHVNKRQFSAKWHPWWGYCYNQRGWKGITGWLTNSCSFIWFWNLIKVAIVTTHPVMAAADDQTKSFLFSHRYVCHWSYYCTQNLSFYFGEMSLKPAPVRLVFKRVQRSKGSATIHKPFFPRPLSSAMRAFTRRLFTFAVRRRGNNFFIFTGIKGKL